MRHVLVYAVALLIAHNAVNVNAAYTPQCRDENNMPVDWYVLYKLPKDSHNPMELLRTGEAYLYMTDRTVDQGWQYGPRSIGADNSFLAKTIAPIYNDHNSEEIVWAVYNDVPPVSQNSKTGHGKGVVMVNNDQGFWLIHSVPKLPLFYFGLASFYPPSGMENGQSFLCVSLGSDQFETVAKQLAYNDVNIFARSVPSKLSTKYSSLLALTANKPKLNPPYTSKAVIRSLNFTEFTSFAKAQRWDDDLYDAFVAPELQTDLYVQSWLTTGDPLRSVCAPRYIFNIRHGTYVDAGIYYPSRNDDSKWATSINFPHSPVGSKNWVCIGDIDRTKSHRKRGGGALCFQHPTVWANYAKLIASIDVCRMIR